MVNVAVTPPLGRQGGAGAVRRVESLNAKTRIMTRREAIDHQMTPTASHPPSSKLEKIAASKTHGYTSLARHSS